MSDEEKKEINEVPPQDIKPDLQDEEEEPVDEEHKKKMKDVKIDDSVFSGEHKKRGLETIWNTPSRYMESTYNIVNEPKLFIPNPLFEKALYDVTWKQDGLLKKIFYKIRRFLQY